VHIPAGYVVESFCAYDNTADNPYNPHDPPEWMSWGDFTTEEMFVLFLQGVPYEEGDEDISLSVPDRNTVLHYSRDNLFPAWPNPARADQVRVGFHLIQPAKASLVLRDMQGRVVKTWLDGKNLPAGHHLEAFDVSALPAGQYLYTLTTSNGTVRSAQLQVLHQ